MTKTNAYYLWSTIIIFIFLIFTTFITVQMLQDYYGRCIIEDKDTYAIVFMLFINIVLIFLCYKNIDKIFIPDDK